MRMSSTATCSRSSGLDDILAQKDQTVHPELQRFLAKRMNATTIETNSSHVVMLSQPDLDIEVIRKAVATVEKGQSE